MTSTVFMKKFAANAGISQAKAHDYLKALESTIVEVLKADGALKVAGLNVKMKNVPEHTGRNPASGDAITIPAKNRVTVKVSKTIKTAVNS